jgi:hypothetical protein
VGNDPPCGDFAVDGERGKVLVEEIEVEREAHAEGVDARAARDEEPHASLIAIEIRKPQQASAKAGRDRNPPATHRVNRKATQTRSRKKVHHVPTSPYDNKLSPLSNGDFAFLPV